MQITARDKKYLLRFQHDWHLNPSEAEVYKDFNNELNFISTVHDSIIAEIKHEEISHSYFGDACFITTIVKDFATTRRCLWKRCFLFTISRSVIYIYFGKGEKKPGIFAFFNEDLGSHAVTEVQTSRGWMLLGANSNWVGIDSSGELLVCLEMSCRQTNKNCCKNR